MNIRIAITVFITVAVPLHLFSQGLFESSLTGDSPSSAQGQSNAVDLSGHVKGGIYGMENSSDDPVIASAMSQPALKFTAKKTDLGKAYAETRIRAQSNEGIGCVDLDIREAWIAMYPGRCEIRLGKQIVAWGRADGINPTNNITPMNILAFSSDFDDMRLGNFLARCRLNLPHVGIEGIWIPLFAADEIAVDETMLPAGIQLDRPDYPDNRLENSSCALRVDLTFPVIDGSLSYFNGYETQPGFNYELKPNGVSLIPRAYRIHAAGADFSTAIKSFGLRGEVCAEFPYKDYDEYVYIPNPSLQAVAGIDRSIGNRTFLLQYSGRYTFYYDNVNNPVLSNPSDPMARQLYAMALTETEVNRLNRLFSGTTDKYRQTVTALTEATLLYETLHLKLAGMYDITTEEYTINPTLSYDITDAFTVTAGGRYFGGPEESLNDLASEILSMVYTELQLSF